MYRWLSIFLLAVLIAAPSHAGKLDRARDEARENEREEKDEKPAPPSKLEAVRHEVRDDHHHAPTPHPRRYRRRPSPGYCAAPAVLVYTEGEYASPIGEEYVVEEEYYLEPSRPEPKPDCYFLDHPYCSDEHPGYLWIEDEENAPWEGSFESRRRIVGQVWVEGGTDFDGLSRIGARGLVDTTTGVGLLGGADVYFEDRPRGGTDSLTLGDFNATLRLGQSECFAFRAGLGARFLADEYGSEWGVNFLIRADVYPARPLVLSGQVDLGTLGDAGIVRIRGTAGYQWHRCEIFVGYDYLDIEGAALQGMMGGVKFSF